MYAPAPLLLALVPLLPHDCEEGHDHVDPGQAIAQILNTFPDYRPGDPSFFERHPGLREYLLAATDGCLEPGCIPPTPFLVKPPARWHPGSTHLHVQGCPTCCDPPDPQTPLLPRRPVEQVRSLMEYFGWEYGQLLLWAVGPLNPDQLKLHFTTNEGFDYTQDPPVPSSDLTYLLGGGEHPHTVGDPENIYTALEVSQFSVSKWGHISALGIGVDGADIFHFLNRPNDFGGAEAGPEPYPWEQAEQNVVEFGLPAPPFEPGKHYLNDGTGKFSRPVLEYMRETNPSATLGWAHERWPIGAYSGEHEVGLYADVCAGGWDWTAPEDPFGLSPNPALVGHDARVTPSDVGLAFPRILVLGEPAEIGAGPFVSLPETVDISRPVFAPFDVAFGLIDFLEATKLDSNATPPYACEPPDKPELDDRWFGLYYKLLSAGQRVAISGGSDYPCAVGSNVLWQPTTYVQLQPGEPATQQTWLRNLRQGRSSVVAGGHQFLGVEVYAPSDVSGTAPVSPGGTVYVDTKDGFPDVLRARVTYRSEPPFDLIGQIELLLNGGLAPWTGSTPSLRDFDTGVDGKIFAFEVEVPVAKSGWLAARAGYSVVNPLTTSHTGAIYVVVDDRPVADAATAEYFTIYADFVNHRIKNFEAKEALSGAGLLEWWVGTQPEIQAMKKYLVAGRRAYAAVRDYGAPPPNVELVDETPPGYDKFGSPPAPPLGIAVDTDPFESSAFTVSCFNAEPGWTAFLSIGSSLVCTPGAPGCEPEDAVFPGAHFWLDPGAPFYVQKAAGTVDGAGVAGRSIAYVQNPSSVGLELYAQYIVANLAGAVLNPSCPGCYASTEVVRLRLQL
ncbi:MAG: hypothetical protein AAF682_18345 [Planctomycetota bacterium]